MDFRSLPRKNLQFLCKRNKIPANLKNVAMADALSSLHSVEGLDELIQLQQTPSPTYTPRNPVRGCRKTSPLVDGGRTSSSKNRGNSIAGCEPTENLTLLNYLLPCEKALSLKHMSACTQTVRGKALQEEKRSVGVQVDCEETEKFLVGNLETNRLDFDDCDEVLVQKEQENDLSVVHEIEICGMGRVDALSSMQKVQDSSNSCEPIANSMDQVSKVVNDDVTDEWIVSNSGIHVEDCIVTSSLENIEVNITSQESGLQSMNIPIHESEIGVESIDLDSDLNNVPHENVIGDNMDELNEEREHKEETNRQNFILKEQVIYLKDCNDTSSLQNVQVATLQQITSPKNIIVEANCTVGIDSVHCLEHNRGEKMRHSSILSESMKAEDMKKVNEDTRFETTVMSNTMDNSCLDNVEVHEASSSFTSDVNEFNMSMVYSVSTKNEYDGGRKCNNVQVTTPSKTRSTKGIILESDSNDGIDSVHVKGCIDSSTLQIGHVSITSPEPDLKSMNLYLYDEQTGIGDIDLNSALESNKNERGGSSSVHCKNVPADNMEPLNEGSEHNEGLQSQNLVQKDQDVYIKDSIDISCLQNVEVTTTLQILSPESIILEAPSIVAIDSMHGLEYDSDEKTQCSSILCESRKSDDMEKLNEETHFEPTKISDIEADRCFDNVKDVEEASSLLTSEVHELNMSMASSALEHDIILAKNEDGERKCNSVQVITSSQRPSPECVILVSDSNVGTDSIYAKNRINTSTLQNDEVSTTSQEPDLKRMNLSLHGEQIIVGDIDLNSDLNSDTNGRGGSSSVPHKNALADNVDAWNEKSGHNEEEHGQYFIQKDKDINVKKCNGTSSLQNVHINPPSQIPSSNKIILEADSIVGVGSVHDMECGTDEKMLSSSILTESLKVNGCFDNVKKLNDSTSLSDSKIHGSSTSVICSALKPDVVLEKIGDDSERKCNEESGEGMSIEIKKEPQSNKKRKHLGELSLRKLRLMYKENKEVIKLKMERETEKDADTCCKEETSKKEESGDICCKEEPSKKEEYANICSKEEPSMKEEFDDIFCKKETNKKEEFGDISLRKLRFMLKSMAKKH